VRRRLQKGKIALKGTRRSGNGTTPKKKKKNLETGRLSRPWRRARTVEGALLRGRTGTKRQERPSAKDRIAPYREEIHCRAQHGLEKKRQEIYERKSRHDSSKLGRARAASGKALAANKEGTGKFPGFCSRPSADKRSRKGEPEQKRISKAGKGVIKQESGRARATTLAPSTGGTL